jgi:Fe-S cluster assembly scaffold protein SufB
MNITKPGFHNISEITEKILTIPKNMEVVFYDEWNSVENIILEQWAKLQYFGYFSKWDIYTKHIITAWVKSQASVNCFLLSKADTKVTAKVIGEVWASHSLIDTDVVSLVSDGWNIDLDGIIQINEWVEKVEGYLDETNIFLWDKWSVRGFPTLLVRSDDVKAGHWCNIEKISDEKLFYMRSRGIGKENALTMIVSSYVETIFADLEKINEEFHNQLVDKILQEI